MYVSTKFTFQSMSNCRCINCTRIQTNDSAHVGLKNTLKILHGLKITLKSPILEITLSALRHTISHIKRRHCGLAARFSASGRERKGGPRIT